MGVLTDFSPVRDPYIAARDVDISGNCSQQRSDPAKLDGFMIQINCQAPADTGRTRAGIESGRLQDFIARELG